MERSDQTRYKETLERAAQLEREGDREGALAAYGEAIVLASERPDAHYEMAVLHHKLGQTDEAIACFERAAELAPGDATVWNNLGVLHFSQRALKGAEANFRRAIEIDPQYAEAIYNLAKVSIELGNTYEGANALAKCLRIDPDFERAARLLDDLRQTGRIPSKKEELARRRKGKPSRIKVLAFSESERDLSKRKQWGDYWVKHELEKEFQNLGLVVVEQNPDAILYLFGVPVKGLPKETYNMVWVYSHPDMVTPRNLKEFDKIFSLSASHTDKLQAMGYQDVDVVIGATAKKPLVREKLHDIVFVGNARGPHGRKIVSDVGHVPYDFKVWGRGWDSLLPPQFYGGRYYDYEKLDELYASSSISLNDHHADMAREGFVAVKIFDILASGGFAISDKNAGIKEIFGDAVPQYESPKHLRELLAFYLTHREERLNLAKEGREIALSHTWRKRAEQFARAALQGMERQRATVDAPVREGPLQLARCRDLRHHRTQDKPRVLYVDTLSEPHAACNVNGMIKAYKKVSILKPFDYRGLATKHGVARMNQMLVEAALEFHPDLIHLGKSESIAGSTIKAIKQQLNTYVIHFYGDFRWDPQSWVVDIGRYADCTLFSNTDDRILSKYRAAGVKHIGGWWDAGTDPEVFYPRNVLKTKDVVLMANNLDIPHDGYVKRRNLVEAALAKGSDVHLYGKGWEYLEEAGYPNLHVHGFVTGDRFAEVCSTAKITLGINGVNDVRMYASWRRAVNSMASGAFHLTHYVPDMETVFENRRHLVWFHSIPEAMELIDYYLSHEEEREAIAASGRQEVLARHTWDARIGQMLARWREGKNGRRSRHLASRQAVAARTTQGVRVSRRARARRHSPRLDTVHRSPIQFISYPKAGRTWLRLLVGKALQLHYHLRVAPADLLEVQNLPRYDARVPAMRFSHDDNPHLKRIFDMEHDKRNYWGASVVFLSRDPRDVVVSNYFQQARREIVLGDAPGFHGSIEEFIRHEVYGIENVIAFMNIWAANRHIPLRFMLLRYEDIIEDGTRELRRVLSFLNVADISMQTLGEAVEFCKFENMKRMEAKDALHSARLRATNPDDPNSYKVRKGKVGGYRDHLSPDDIAYVDELVAERLDSFFKYCDGFPAEERRFEKYPEAAASSP